MIHIVDNEAMKQQDLGLKHAAHRQGGISRGDGAGGAVGGSACAG